MTDRAQPVAWIEDLVSFLHTQPGVTAVRVDPEGKRLAVATLGEIDRAALESRLTGAIAAIESRLAAGAKRAAAAVPSGFVSRQVGGATEVARETCATAPTFWRWSEFAWPEPPPAEAPPGYDSEWRMLAALAGACGVLGLTAFAGGHFWNDATGLTRVLYLLALVAGGWDATKDTWKKVRQRKLDIHFLMLAVAAGCGGDRGVGRGHAAAVPVFVLRRDGGVRARSHASRSERAAQGVAQEGHGRAVRRQRAPGPDRGGRHWQPRAGETRRDVSGGWRCRQRPDGQR